MSQREHVTFIAEGELSLYQQDIVERYLRRHDLKVERHLGEQGLSTEVSVKNIPEQEVRLGYISYEDLRSFTASEQPHISQSFYTLFWNNMVRISHANDPSVMAAPAYSSEIRGKVRIRGQWAELFKIAPDAHESGVVGGNKGVKAKGYGLNLDTLECLVESNLIRTYPKVGEANQEFARGLLEYRKLQKAVELGDEPDIEAN